MEYQTVTDVDNVANVDFLPSLFRLLIGEGADTGKFALSFCVRSPCTTTQNFAGFLTFLCDFSRNSTPLVHPAKIKKPHNQAIIRLSVYPEPGSNRHILSDIGV